MCKAPNNFWTAILASHKLYGRETATVPVLHVWKRRYHVLLLLQMWSDAAIDQVIVLHLPVLCHYGIVTFFALLGEEEESSRPDKIKSV